MIRYIFIIIFTFFLSSCDFDTSFKIELGNKESSYQPIPGPRDCFWSRGPVSKDPYINIAFPVASVFYWSANFSVPEGARLYLSVTFPYSRYLSVISSSDRCSLIESLADFLFL